MNRRGEGARTFIDQPAYPGDSQRATCLTPTLSTIVEREDEGEAALPLLITDC